MSERVNIVARGDTTLGFHCQFCGARFVIFKKRYRVTCPYCHQIVYDEKIVLKRVVLKKEYIKRCMWILSLFFIEQILAQIGNFRIKK